jgi:surface antigen
MTSGSSRLSLLRITKEDTPKPGDESWKYWQRYDKGGLNKCRAVGPNKDIVLPNCTGYAWGRFYEILGEEPKLSTGNAGDWYTNTSDGYERGQTPKPGAVMCWSEAGQPGHVAIVESYDSTTGELITSESGFRQKGQTNLGGNGWNTVYNPDKYSYHWWVAHYKYDESKSYKWKMFKL